MILQRHDSDILILSMVQWIGFVIIYGFDLFSSQIALFFSLKFLSPCPWLRPINFYFIFCSSLYILQNFIFVTCKKTSSSCWFHHWIIDWSFLLLWYSSIPNSRKCLFKKNTRKGTNCKVNWALKPCPRYLINQIFMWK
jgi:hypothetical protein